MYDAVLIAPHYNYDDNGRPLPPPDDTAFQDLSMVVPMGITHLAQFLHDSGFNVRVIHLPQALYTLRQLGLPVERMENPVETILKQYPARVCGLQAHFYLYAGGAVHVAGIYRRLFPESTILVGGYMATACWQAFLKASAAIDGVVLGEGEIGLRKVVEASPSAGPVPLRGIDGIASRGADGAFHFNPPRREALLAITDMPIIDPGAAPFKDLLWSQRAYLNISRGRCPEGCAYCVANNRTINVRPFQTMLIERILAQLKLFQQTGIRGIFLGENHFLNTDFLTALIEAIIHADLDLYFELETHPTIFADRDLLRRMIAAGFLRFTMGCETGSDRLLRHMGRRSNTRQIMAGVEQLAEAGGLVTTSWIANLPGETTADHRATLALMNRVVAAGGFIYWVENLHVLPGSPLHANPQKWDIELLLTNLTDWFRWSLRSKAYVDFAAADKAPRDFLTHLNRNSDPREMIDRLYTLRRRARDLVPAMQRNLEARGAHLPAELALSEQEKLAWYAERGWKLWLF
ncbi:MAG: radical SAM protein [Desulfobacterales bacterium]|nr:radical SAM protein [Desulfobacterales bacterium]